MSDPQIVDLSVGCVALVAPEGKPYATIVALPDNKVSVAWDSKPYDPAAVQAAYWPVANATQYAVYDTYVDCAAIPTNLVPANNLVTVYAEDVSVNAPACIMPGTVYVPPTVPTRGITLKLVENPSNAVLHPASFRNVQTDLYFAGWVKVTANDASSALWLDLDNNELDKALHVLIEFG